MDFRFPVYNYGCDVKGLSVSDPFDELGEKRKKLTFRYYDCFCGESKYRIVSTKSRHNNHFDFVQCQSCGALRINPYFSQEAVDLYYKEVYGPVKRLGISAQDLYEKQSKVSNELYDFISPFVTKDTEILDFGGGAGGKLHRFIEEGYKLSIEESDEKYKDYALSKGFKLRDTAKKYEFVNLCHVLEHSIDPVSFLEFLNSLMTSDGLLMVEVPYFDNGTKLLRHFHVSHKFYFLEGHIVAMAEHAGLKVEAKSSKRLLLRKFEESSKRPFDLDKLKALKKTSDQVVRKSERHAKMRMLLGRFN